MTQQGWRFGDFPGADRDTLNGAVYLHEIYTLADPHFTGRATVPVLWDKKRRTIVNNESADILRMLNSGFGALADAALDLYPADLAERSTRSTSALCAPQQRRLSRGLRDHAGRLRGSLPRSVRDARRIGGAARGSALFLFGDRLTETDIRVFVTLVRFDAAYHGIFKCNLRRIADYPALRPI